ncbi:uncharacterized protein LOC132270256 [Cornus florida]|uniref:uncharacterized protein LOC132270256 n=1 Tax=Cornus florida TaxID=4283 RepID=UPI00289A0B43|nr:uncharacterized protein LOC132270256 [Cornus florida]
MGSLEASDWAWLPKHLLGMIVDNLVSLSDCVRFGAVCKSWLLVAMENKVKFVQNKCVPFLLVPTKNDDSKDDECEEIRSLYSITHNKVYNFQLQVPYNKKLFGSSHGWLFTVEESFALTLINQFSGAIVELPPIMDSSEFHAYDLLSVIYGGLRTLTFIVPGDKAWTFIDKKFTLIRDVIYYKGQIFAVDYRNGIIMVDLNRRDGETKVPQVKQSEKDMAKWVKVKSLGGDTLFLGDNHSICVSSSKWCGCQPNSIYYTDDYIELFLPCHMYAVTLYTVLLSSALVYNRDKFISMYLCAGAVVVMMTQNGGGIGAGH